MNTLQAKNSGAQFYQPMKDGVTPQLYYRYKDIKYNDGTTEPRLQYLSTCGGGWMGSMEKNPEEFVKNKLVKI